MCFFRTNFPDNSFPPQLHVLEEYVIPFRSKWHFRLGFFSEQGGKSVDHEFAQLASTFFHAKPATLRLKKMMEKHHFLFHPKNSWTSNCSIQHIYEWSCLRDKTLVIVLKTAQREASELLLREKDVFCPTNRIWQKPYLSDVCLCNSLPLLLSRLSKVLRTNK